MNHDLGGDFGGAPNPLYFIDLEVFGQRLIDTGNARVYCQLPNGKIVTTSYGW